MPHEGAVRAWLSRSRVLQEDADDMVQEAYCRLAGLEQFEHIERPDAYFFSTVRNLLFRQSARAKVVPLRPVSEMEDAEDPAPSPEREAVGRIDYERMVALIEQLPERRRRVISLRKIEGKAQREIADILGLSENVIEHEIRQGVLDLKRAWERGVRDPSGHQSLTGQTKGTRR